MNDVGNAWCYIKTVQYPNHYFPLRDKRIYILFSGHDTFLK